ncbi:hypothetical protein N9955_01035 [bacterium]|nr:hypothetical protein [bacterium]
MRKPTQKQRQALNSIRNSKGRFFGLYTTSGEVMNAQFMGESEHYINVYDRNNQTYRKLAKTSVKTVNLG